MPDTGFPPAEGGSAVIGTWGPGARLAGGTLRTAGRDPASACVKMSRTRYTLGAILVLLLGVGIWHRSGHATPPPPLRRVLVHYNGGVNDSALPLYRELLAQLPADAELIAVTSSEGDARTLRSALAAQARLRLLSVRGPLSPWARDRYLLFERGSRLVCLASATLELPAHWRGDGEVPDALRGVYPHIEVIRSPFVPVGGDTLILADRVLLGRGSLDAAAKVTGLSREAVRSRLASLFGRPLLVVGAHGERLPRTHIDLFIADAGGGRVLVADPRRAESLFREERFEPAPGVRFDAAENRRLADELDEIARQLEDAGLAVHRIVGLFGRPRAPSAEGPTLTYTNVESLDRRVFLPHYGIGSLDAAARTTWQELGFVCVPLNVRGTILNGGAVRCLTNAVPGPNRS